MVSRSPHDAGFMRDVGRSPAGTCRMTRGFDTDHLTFREVSDRFADERRGTGPLCLSLVPRR